jgi:hypothetical protein
MDSKKVQIGAKVKIKPHHWLRALEDGTVIGYRSQTRHSWLVQFEHNYPGGGIDGDKLYFDEAEFAEVELEHGNGHVGIEPSTMGSRKLSNASTGVDIYG